MEQDTIFIILQRCLPGYSLTVEVDITNTYHTVKRAGKKFFPAYLYLASRLISQQQGFRIAEQNGQLGYYEVLHPSYACFHEDNRTMSSLWAEYDSDFETFYNNYMKDQRQYAGNPNILFLRDPDLRR